MSWRRYLQRDSSVRDRSEELTSYLEIETDQNMERGMEPRQARRAAQKKLGNRTRILEEIYWMNTLTFIDSVARDLRYAMRGLVRNPGFAAVAVLTLGLGIGANTAVFSVVNRVLIQPLPYPDSDRLVALTLAAPGATGLGSVSGNLQLSASMYFTFAEENQTFGELGIYSFRQVAVTGFDQPEQVLMLGVSDGTLQALDVAPVLGRWLEAEDQVFGGPERAMLGYGYWQQRFGGDPSVIGKKIIVDSRPREIVGVMPREFSIEDERPDLFLPFAFNRSELELPGFGFDGVGRLKPGVTLDQANTDIERLISVWNYSWPAFEGVDPSIYEQWQITARLRPLKDSVDRQCRDHAMDRDGFAGNRDVDRVRECGESAPGPDRSTTTGIEYARGAGSEPFTDPSGVDAGEPCAGRVGRDPRDLRRVRESGGAGTAGAGVVAAAQ